MPKACIVPNCWKTFKGDTGKCSMFRVPQDEKLRRKWEAAIPGIQTLKTSQHVCERHFEPECIVRSLIKRAPNGQILIDTPYKRPRLGISVVPSIFYPNLKSRNKEAEQKSNSNVNKIDVHDKDYCAIPEIASQTSLENQQDAENSFLVQPCDENEEILAMSDIKVEDEFYDEFQFTNEEEKVTSFADDLSVKTELCTSRNDFSLTFSVTNDSVIHFATIDGICSVSLPNAWSVVESSIERKLMLSQIATFGGVAVISKGIIIDEKGKITYAVNGRPLRHEVPGLPQELTDPQDLPVIAKEFYLLRICDGLRETNIGILQPDTVCNDTTNVNRSTMCMLIGRQKTCSFCARLRKTLRQKNLRHTKREETKRFSAPSNPADRITFRGMRLKLNRERRAKNRRTRRIKILTDYLTQQQDKFAVMKEHLLEELCVKLKIPKAQQCALQEILAAAKQNDVRGRRYSKEWIMLCMLMNIRSPTYYELLKKNEILPLPCTRTIRSYFSLIDSRNEPSVTSLVSS